jgi:TRAP-type C4-dicarboxylate transport system permease small subunit
MGIVDRTLEALVSALLVVTVVIAFTEVVFRYGLNSSLEWSFEFLLIVLTYMTFVSAFLALRKRAHLRILVILLALPRPGQALVFVLNQIGIGVTVAVMTYWGWDLAWKFPFKVTLILGWPVTWLYIIIPISGAAMGLQVVWDLAAGIRRLLAGLPPEVLVAEPGPDGTGGRSL